MVDDATRDASVPIKEPVASKERVHEDEPATLQLASKAFVEAIPTAFLAAERATASDSYAYAALGDVIDRTIHASVAHVAGGLSLAALMGACWDWAIHLASSPGKQMQLRRPPWAPYSATRREPTSFKHERPAVRNDFLAGKSALAVRSRVVMSHRGGSAACASATIWPILLMAEQRYPAAKGGGDDTDIRGGSRPPKNDDR